jgi:hypothetical protein
VVHADPAMKLHLTVVLGIHDQAKLEQPLSDQQNCRLDPSFTDKSRDHIVLSASIDD